ncbi:MAG: 23S rRNA (pseudouridine(1915)-N(3))-methyltransferase RlmH [Pseudomonadota bacterium]
MLKLRIIAIGDKMPAWVSSAFSEYEKRVRGRFTMNLIEIAAERRGNTADIKKVLRREEDRIRRSIGSDSIVVALDRTGRELSTTQIADEINIWLMDSRDICFIIGGPEGLSKDFMQSSDRVWSFSKMTMAHPIARVVLAEQLYRCCSILDGLPYHR